MRSPCHTVPCGMHMHAAVFTSALLWLGIRRPLEHGWALPPAAACMQACYVLTMLCQQKETARPMVTSETPGLHIVISQALWQVLPTLCPSSSSCPPVCRRGCLCARMCRAACVLACVTWLVFLPAQLLPAGRHYLYSIHSRHQGGLDGCRCCCHCWCCCCQSFPPTAHPRPAPPRFLPPPSPLHHCTTAGA